MCRQTDAADQVDLIVHDSSSDRQYRLNTLFYYFKPRALQRGDKTFVFSTAVH